MTYSPIRTWWSSSSTTRRIRRATSLTSTTSNMVSKYFEAVTSASFCVGGCFKFFETLWVWPFFSTYIGFPLNSNKELGVKHTKEPKHLSVYLLGISKFNNARLPQFLFWSLFSALLERTSVSVGDRRCPMIGQFISIKPSDWLIMWGWRPRDNTW